MNQPHTIQEILLHNDFLSVSILNLGATIAKIICPDAAGTALDLTLGYDTVDQYKRNMGFFGVTVGRCTNRIANATFQLDGTQVQVTANAGPHHIHGGNNSFALQYFDIVSQTDTSVVLVLNSPDGQDGYPGNLSLSVTYKLSGSALHIIYQATADKTTIINLTNHAYFNLNGSGSVLQHRVTSPADSFCASDLLGIPQERTVVTGTPFDFREENTLDAFIRNPHPQTEQYAGYDHHFLVNGEGYRHMLTAYGEKSGIRMDVMSTQEGFQLFTANNMHNIAGKNAQVYEPYCGFCVETQTAPNAVNRPFNRSPVLKAGQTYYQKTTYQFSCVE